MAMNDAPSRVRAVVRVGGDPSSPPEPATFVRRRRHGYLGPVNVLQLVIVEAVLVVLLVLLRNNPILLIVGIVLAALLLVATFARSGGRWWVERALIRRQYRRRQHTGRLPADDPRLVTLHHLVPDLTVETIDGVGGTQVGIGRDAAGSFATVAVVRPDGVNGDPLGRLPLSKLAAIANDSEQPGAVIQVVTHGTPAPDAAIDGMRPAAESYRELMDQFGGAMPADQVVWVSARFDARTVAEAYVGGADESKEIPVMITALIRRIGKALKRSGLEYQVLDGDGLLDALARSCDLEQSHDESRQADPRESWTYWRSATLAHTCFWVSSWPDLRRSGELFDRLGRTPAAALTSVSLIMAPRQDVTEIRALVRVAAPEPGALSRACAAAEQIASSGGGGLFRLNGEQAQGVYASAPSGGGAR